jgi:hypothetical protein
MEFPNKSLINSVGALIVTIFEIKPCPAPQGVEGEILVELMSLKCVG